MSDPKVARDPLYYRRTEPQALAARPHAPVAADEADDAVLYDDRTIWLCMAGAAALACLVGSGFGTAGGAAAGLAAGSAAVLAAMMALPAAHGARTPPDKTHLYRIGFAPALLALAIVVIQFVPTFRAPLAGAAICLAIAGAYRLFVPHYASAMVWPTVVAWPAGFVLGTALGWPDPLGIALVKATLGLVGGMGAALVWVALGRRFSRSPRTPSLRFLVAAPCFCLLVLAAMARPPAAAGMAVAAGLIIGSAWWMRAPTVRQAVMRSIPLLALLNFWGGSAIQFAAAPWLGPLSAVAVVMEFALVVMAMARVAHNEAALEASATYYATPLAPVPRPDRAFDYPFESYARDP